MIFINVRIFSGSYISFEKISYIQNYDTDVDDGISNVVMFHTYFTKIIQFRFSD